MAAVKARKGGRKGGGWEKGRERGRGKKKRRSVGETVEIIATLCTM
jgi:hypothetical protein